MVHFQPSNVSPYSHNGTRGSIAVLLWKKTHFAPGHLG